MIVDAPDYRLDLTVTPQRIAIAYLGDYGPEAITAMYLLDFLHEQGQLPTNPATLSALQLANLSDLKLDLAEEAQAA